MRCPACSTQWDPGYFNNRLCPQCNRKLAPGIGRYLKMLFKSVLWLGALAFAALWLKQDEMDRELKPEAFLMGVFGFPNFLASGPQGFLTEAVAPMPEVNRPLIVTATTPALRTLPVGGFDPDNADFTLAAGQRVQALELVRRQGRLWLHAEAYQGDEKIELYLMNPLGGLPRLGDFNFDGAVAALRQRDLEQARKKYGNRIKHDAVLKAALKTYLDDEAAYTRQILQLQPDYKRPPFRAGNSDS